MSSMTSAFSRFLCDSRKPKGENFDLCPKRCLGLRMDLLWFGLLSQVKKMDKSGEEYKHVEMLMDLFFIFLVMFI